MNVVNRIIHYARIDLIDLHNEAGVVTKEAFDEALSAARDYTESRLKIEVSDEDVREAEIVLEGLFNVFVGNEHLLVNNEGHIEWLEHKAADISWDYWERYRQWLIEDEHRPAALVDSSLHPITDQILGLLEDPLRQGSWARRGLVAGQVQSGKTSNYVALVNKALDAGYKLIVILAGTHDNLRSQTQLRINAGVLGFNTQGNINGSQGKRVGVGLKDGRKPRINCPTSSAQKGDFNRKLASGVGALGGDPVILVVKKQTSILNNLYAWATGLHHEIDPDTGQRIVRNVPMLLIDDEADYASIDTGSVKDKITGVEADPSATNKLIRQLLGAFEKSAYVGYTATPFANIFINPSANHGEFGKDLFPEHFIVTLPEASTYSGAARIFGVVQDDSAGLEGVSALPTTREVDDYQTWLPDGHRKWDLPQGDLPESLKEAVRSFIIASALKRARRTRTKHNSMLVHVTRFVDVQESVAQQLEEFVSTIRNGVLYSMIEDLASVEWCALRCLYLGDFVSVHEAMAGLPDLDGQLGVMPTFEELGSFIELVVVDLQISCVNGLAKEALQYEETPDGLTVIAVGGDKLSRGLTLDGLTTSYYLRASRMYDTLMQMGRWFGYRPGYLDTCRLYTTSQLVRWYTRITGASERLYREFELMAALGKTPVEFGLRVQAHPDGLMVTAANKSRFAKNVRASFSGTVSETILFRSERAARRRNESSLRELYAEISINPDIKSVESRRAYWRSVPASTVLRFLDGYDAHLGALRALPKAMAEYIRACGALREPELTSWDVLIASKADMADPWEIAEGYEIGLIERSSDSPRTLSTYVIGRLVSTSDELLPLAGDPTNTALAIEQAVENWKGSARKNKGEEPRKATAVAERRIRNAKRGFLLVYPLQRQPSGLEKEEAPYVGFAIAFPWSENAPSVDYRVNEIYWDLEMDQDPEEIDDDD